MASNVQALRIFSDNEALAWLRSHGPATPQSSAVAPAVETGSHLSPGYWIKERPQ
jgi:hypothetical protein